MRVLSRNWRLLALVGLALLPACTPPAIRDGIDQFQQGAYESSIESLQQGLKQYHEQSGGDIFTSQADIEAARIYLRIARRKAAEARCERGARLYRAGSLMEAEREFQKAAEIDPTNLLASKMSGQVDRQKTAAKAMVKAGTALMARKDFDGALDRLSKASDAAPAFPQIRKLMRQASEGSFQQHLAQGNARFAKRQYAQAADEFSMALRRRPTDKLCAANRSKAVRHVKAQALSADGAKALAAGRLRAALDSFAAALQWAPSYPEALAGQKDASAKLATQLVEQASAQAAEPYHALELLAEAERLAPGRDDIQTRRRAVGETLSQRLFSTAQRLLGERPSERLATAHALLEEAHTHTPSRKDIQAAADRARKLLHIKAGLWLCLQPRSADARAVAIRLSAALAQAGIPLAHAAVQSVRAGRAGVLDQAAALGATRMPALSIPAIGLLVEVRESSGAVLDPAPGGLQSQYISGSQVIENPRWVDNARQLDAQLRVLEKAHAQYSRARDARETASLVRIQAQIRQEAASYAHSLVQSLHNDLANDARAFAASRLPKAAAAAEAAAKEVAPAVRATSSRLTAATQALNAAVNALQAADGALRAAESDARRAEQQVMRLQRYLDSHDRQMRKDVVSAYRLQTLTHRLSADVAYSATAIDDGGRTLARLSADMHNHIERPRIVGARATDVRDQRNRIDRLASEGQFFNELRDAAFRRLYGQLLAFATAYHRRFWDAARAAREAEPADAVEAYLCFLAANRGQSPADCRVARAYVTSHIHKLYAENRP